MRYKEQAHVYRKLLVFSCFRYKGRNSCIEKLAFTKVFDTISQNCIENEAFSLAFDTHSAGIVSKNQDFPVFSIHVADQILLAARIHPNILTLV